MAGQEDYDRLRANKLPDSDVILFCFCVSNKDSFNNITNKWIPHVKEPCPDTPFLLVGTKSDLRDDPAMVARLQERGKTFVTCEEGVALALQIGAAKYLECSGLTQQGLAVVFAEAVRAALQGAKAGKKEEKEKAEEVAPPGTLENVEEVRIREARWNGRKGVLDELLSDGVIEQDVYDRYLQKHKEQ